MKILTMLSLLTTVATRLSAQSAVTYANNTPVPISDSVTASTILLEADPCLGNAYEVTAVTVNIAYPVTGFLAIALNDQMLSSYNGGDGANYVNTTLVSASSPDVPHVGQGEAPFTGTYAAELNFSHLSTQPITGEWVLKAFTPAGAFDGAIESWSISFICMGSVPTAVERTNNTQLSVYPNPAQNTVGYTSDVLVDRVMFYDVTNRLVLENETERSASAGVIDIGILSPGIYRAVFQSGDELQTVSVVVSR